jgi:predicted ribonuclease YlaK
MFVFYIKTDLQKGKRFYDFWQKSQESISLPLIYYSEIEMVGAVMFQLAGDLEKAVEIYEELLGNQGNEFLSKGLILNNYAVCLMNLRMDDVLKDNEFRVKLEELFKDAVLEIEGNF